VKEDVEEMMSELCRYWQMVLKLQDWNIDVELCSTRDLERLKEGQRTAFNTVYPSLHKSFIRIKELEERYNEDGLEEDMEVDLVHELLHLHFDGLYCDEKREIAAEVVHERALNAVAEALVTFRRELHGEGEEERSDAGTCPCMEKCGEKEGE